MPPRQAPPERGGRDLCADTFQSRACPRRPTGRACRGDSPVRSFNVAHRAAGPGMASTAATPAPPVRGAGRALRGNGTHGPLLLALTVLAAYATPEIAIRDAWPAVRIEQVAALGAGLWLLRRRF